MHEAHRVRPSPLKVQRAFAGNRLEEQILARVYELAVPILRTHAGAVPTPTAGLEFAEGKSLPQRIAQGA